MGNINLKNFNLSKNNIDILSDINFSFDKNISLIGTSHSGKTSLLKVLEDKYNVHRIYKNFMFYNSSIEDELKYLLLNDTQKKIVSDLLPNINLKINPTYLKNNQKIKLCILKKLLHNSSYISFDNILTYLNRKDKKNIINYLKRNNILFIIVSNDLNDLLYTDETYILNNGSVIAHGASDKIILEEKLLKRLGFTLPFMIDLSLQLKNYKLVNSIYLDKKLMIDKLWKNGDLR